MMKRDFMKQNLTASVYSFEKLRNEGYLYVDKTEYIWQMINPAGESYFLSRPRRFGKSLTVSTLKAVFEGKKELFKGLAIYDKPYDWKPYPIIHLDMASCDVHTEEDLRDYLVRMMSRLAKQHNVNVNIQRNLLSSSFSDLIEEVAKTAPVVILLDEYDKPILENIASPEILSIRNTLADFYSAIKAEMDFERFVFVTGVSKFCHVSLFSKLNNLTDITMDARYAAMLGYTQSEFEKSFKDWIASVEPHLGFSHDDLLSEIKNWYDGYRFVENSETVYNPVSLANFFINNGKFDNYWFSTGTTSAIFELMKKQSFDLPGALETTVSAAFFEAFEIDQLNPKTLLYQTGYLTIGKTVKVPVPFTKVQNTEYTLVFPNHEVKSSFNDHLLKYYANVQTDQSQRLIRELIQEIGTGNADGFMKRLQVLFANIPYDMRGKQEHDYQTIIYVIFMMLHFFIEAEHHTNEGRIDLMFCAGEWIYVIELKMDKTAEEALKQIKDKHYADKFRNRGKRIMLIGANFDSEKGQLTNWVKEEIQ